MNKQFRLLNDAPMIKAPNISELNFNNNRRHIFLMLKKYLQLNMLESRYNDVISILGIDNNIKSVVRNGRTYYLQEFASRVFDGFGALQAETLFIPMNMFAQVLNENFMRSALGFQKKIILLNIAILDSINDFEAHYNMLIEQGYSKQQSLNSAFFSIAQSYMNKIAIIDELSGADIYLEAEIHKAYPHNPEKGKRLMKYLEYKFR